MFDINEDFIADDLDMLSEILNPVEDKTIKLEEGENRVVSILFLDIKGFTAMSEKMTSENVKRTMDKILTAFSNSIIKYGGYIDKYEGDLIMALFGSKITSETDTERAINAGLKILSDLKHINKILNIDLSVRIGINTGEVTTGKVGMKREGDFTVYGDAVNLASRMESNAQVNTIMLPKETKEIVHDYFLFEDLGEIKVKGKEKPISVFRILSKNPKKIERWERNRSIIKKSTYVGRDKEINGISDLFNISKKEIGSIDNNYKPIIIGLRGPAGIGKSRLVKEFTDKVNSSQNTILSGYTKSYAQPAYFIWTTMLKDHFNIDDEDSKETIKKKLDNIFDNLISIAEERQELLEARNVIGYMFGVKYEDVRLEKIDPHTLQALINISIRHTIESISFKINRENKVPLVIYFDDCQWLDEASQHLLRTFLASINAEEKREKRENKNLIFLLTYRPEFEILKEFNFDSRFTEFKLNPLTIDNSKELIDSMLGENNIPEHLIEKIMADSSGNPFYIEELVSYLIEKEKIVINDSKWNVVGEVENIQIPLSLNSIILSRIDNLKEDLKNILQKASVIGHHFIRAILKEVSRKVDNVDIDKDFSRLVDDNWFYNENDEDNYLFKHILATNVCYNAILRYNKRILHKIIAETTEEIFKDNKDHFAFIASHYEKSDPEIGSKEMNKLLEYLEKAGDHAKDNFENNHAIKFYNNLINMSQLSDVTYIRINLKLSSILELTGEWDEAEKIYKECLDIAERIGDKLDIAKCSKLLGTIVWKKGDSKTAIQYYEISLKLNKEMKNKKGISLVKRDMGIAYRNQGNYKVALECFELDVGICEELGDKHQISKAVGNLGIIYGAQGNYQKAMDCYYKQLNIFEELGDKQGITKAVGNMGIVYRNQGNYEKAKEHFEKILRISEELGDKQGISKAVGNIGIIYMDQGNYKKAMQYFERDLKISEELGDKQGISIVNGNMGIVYRNLNNYERAMECYNEQLNIAKELGSKRGVSIAIGNMGIIYKIQGNYEKAMECYNEQLKKCEELNDQRGISVATGNIGLIYLAQGDYEKALDYFEKDLNLCQEIGDKTGTSYAFNNLGNVYKETNDSEKALEYCNKSITIDRELGLKPHLMGCLYNKLEILYRSNEYQVAKEDLKEVQLLSQELKDNEMISKVSILKEKLDKLQ
ncbi:MAG: tetratricopeptide repeat protein [Candidatus Delongbacteria bacterium]|nr:tetratricopeptide repeat protein [Candidatus Delongbacteria bacterium]